MRGGGPHPAHPARARYGNLIRAPDRRTLIGKRDAAMLQIMGDCGLRNTELRELSARAIRRYAKSAGVPDRLAHPHGVDLDALSARRRPLIRYCLDWTEQRHHLAGALGAAIADRLFELGWLRHSTQRRAVLLTDTGRAGLSDALGLHSDGHDGHDGNDGNDEANVQ